MGILELFALRILHLESTRYSETALESLRRDFELTCLQINTQDELNNHLALHQYEVIVTRIGLMLNSRLLEGQGKLKYIISSTTGLNHIDIDYCQKAAIEIISLKGEFEFLSTIKSTAEHTWMLLLALLRNLSQSNESVLEGHWKREPFMADELDGKTLGIIGYGRLGKIVANYGKAFGMKVLIHDRISMGEELSESIKQVSLPELLINSDVNILLISYSKENEGFINKDAFQGMKKGAYFINTSRGELIDEAALIESLESGHIRGAALDVLKGDSSWAEAVPEGNSILQYARTKDNILLTPHMGGYGKVSILRTRDFITKKFIEKVKSDRNEA